MQNKYKELTIETTWIDGQEVPSLIYAEELTKAEAEAYKTYLEDRFDRTFYLTDNESGIGYDITMEMESDDE